MAGPLPQEFLENVRGAGDIVQVVTDYVPLKPAGSRLKGLCPFHQEKTPSFSVDPKAQLFYCFGCQTGGDVFKFVQLYESISFTEAVVHLAKRFGIPVPGTDGRRDKKEEAEDRLRRINRHAEELFRKLLTQEAAATCRAYLERRGLSAETVERLRLGYAADSWNALLGHLVAKRFHPQELLNAGLVLPRKSGSGEYDRFRDRLIFPIRDISGRTVAFGGRALAADAEPKYINSPETPVYKKGDHLYGLDLAREAIRREGLAVVVEGYMDVAAVVQAGIDNVVASLGTAFTQAQARLLARYTDRVVFSYDGDGAGAKATERSLDTLLAAGFEVRIVELPTGQDPDDFIRENGPAAYGQRLRQAPDYLEFLVRRQVAARDLARPEEKVAAINAVLPHVAKLESPIARGEWAAKLADRLAIEDELVLQELRGAVRARREQVRQRPAGAQPVVREVEYRLVTVLLRSATEREQWADALDLDDLRGTEIGPIVEAIVRLTKQGREVDYRAVFEALDEGSHRDLLTRIAFRDEPETGPTVEDCLWAFRRRKIVHEGRQVRRAIADLQQDQVPPEEVDRQLQRLEQLARQRDAFLNCEEP